MICLPGRFTVSSRPDGRAPVHFRRGATSTQRRGGYVGRALRPRLRALGAQPLGLRQAGRIVRRHRDRRHLRRGAGSLDAVAGAAAVAAVRLRVDEGVREHRRRAGLPRPDDPPLAHGPIDSGRRRPVGRPPLPRRLLTPAATVAAPPPPLPGLRLRPPGHATGGRGRPAPVSGMRGRAFGSGGSERRGMSRVVRKTVGAVGAVVAGACLLSLPGSAAAGWLGGPGAAGLAGRRRPVRPTGRDVRRPRRRRAGNAGLPPALNPGVRERGVRERGRGQRKGQVRERRSEKGTRSEKGRSEKGTVTN